MKRVATYLVAAGAIAIWLGVIASGLDFTGIDRTVMPGDDFFAFANGAWDKATAIPEDRSAYGVQAIVQDLTRDRIVELIQNSTRAGASSDERKVGDYYASFMDEAAIEAQGHRAAPSAARRHRRHRATSARCAVRLAQPCAPTWTRSTPRTSTPRTSSACGSRRSSTIRRTTCRSCCRAASGMPDRDYYVATSARMAEIRAAYQAHIAAMLDAGRASPDARTQGRSGSSRSRRRIAEAHMRPRVESEGRSSRATILEARRLCDRARRGSTGTAFFQAAGLAGPAAILVWHPKAVAGIAALVAAEPLDTWKEWLAFHASSTRRCGCRRRSSRSALRSTARC